MPSPTFPTIFQYIYMYVSNWKQILLLKYYKCSLVFTAICLIDHGTSPSLEGIFKHVFIFSLCAKINICMPKQVCSELNWKILPIFKYFDLLKEKSQLFANTPDSLLLIICLVYFLALQHVFNVTGSSLESSHLWGAFLNMNGKSLWALSKGKSELIWFVDTWSPFENLQYLWGFKQRSKPAAASFK